ncbi:MAG: mannosyltransferase putative-domain-containing protein [Monoraphidium minutum]|nr:MAG: mannosyltransferase putative-domain-containing protein [Monoraphidium minutum]
MPRVGGSQRVIVILLIAMVPLAASVAAAAASFSPETDAPEFEPVPGAPPLGGASGGAAAAADPRAFAEAVLRQHDSGGKLSATAAAQLLSDVRDLGESLASGAARARWRALQRRRRQRLERGARCAAAGGGAAARRECAARLAREAAAAAAASGRANSAAPPPEPLSAPRGVLIVAGGPHGLFNAYVLLRSLRRAGCALPVEVVYYGNAEFHAPAAALLLGLDGAEAEGGGGGGDGEVDGWDDDDGSGGGDAAAGQCAASEGGGGACSAGAARAPRRVRLVDGLAYHEARLAPLRPHRPLPGGLRGFAAKVHALCFVTSFERVLLLDADNTALQDPTQLFSDPTFERHGNLFWPDFWTDMWINLSLYRLLAMPVPWEEDPSELAAEAGQLVLDRVAHYDTLEYLWLLMTHPEVVGACIWGDKDAYRIAFHLAGKGAAYQPVRAPPRQLLGQPPGGAGGGGAPSGPLHHLGMAQLAPDGRSALFYHRTAAGKLFPHCIHRWRASLAACVPAWLSLPLSQPQLLASVGDPTEMVFHPRAVDTEWHKTHCAGARARRAAAAAGDAAAALLLPECGPGWEARRPVPLLPVGEVPGLAAVVAWVHDDVFLPLLAGTPAQRRAR